MSPELYFLISSYLVLGAFVGFSAGLLGIGGGLILVPALYYILGHFGDTSLGNDNNLMHIALATSMAIILPTGISSSYAQIKRKAVDWQVIKKMSVGLVLGTLAGVLIVTEMDAAILKIIFAIGLTLIAISFILKKEESQPLELLKKQFVVIPATTVFGVLASFLGIGGAVLNVPYMNRMGVPLKTSIANGSVLGVVISCIATVSYLLMGQGEESYINWVALISIIPMSVIFAPLGVRASHALPASKLKVIFAVLLIVVATKMIFEVV
jgi:uncharacterized membrane protein YfcA